MMLKFDFVKPSITKDFTFVDICAGIGGMRIAFENLGGKCVFSSEWDKFCKKTYEVNFGDVPLGDITKIPIKQIPDHDILLAGFPCQPFSKAGYATRRNLNHKNGFEDKNQGNIFFRIEKIIAKKKPKVVFLENVAKLLVHDKERTLNIIIKKLEKLGYTINYKVVSSEGLVPQRRARIYIVAVLDKTKFEFPEIPDLEPKLKNILEHRVNKKYVLSDKLWLWLQRHAKKHAQKGNGFGFRMANKNKTSCTLSARYYKDGSEILIPRRNGNPRKLTPRECARLMGFPDEFEIPVSDLQAYKQFGNSVVVPMIYLLGFEIIRSIFGYEEKLQKKPIKVQIS